jgi:hypothetical protein
MTGKDNDSYKFERCGNKIMKNNQEPCTMYSKWWAVFLVMTWVLARPCRYISVIFSQVPSWTKIIGSTDEKGFSSLYCVVIAVASDRWREGLQINIGLRLNIRYDKCDKSFGNQLSRVTWIWCSITFLEITDQMSSLNHFWKYWCLTSGNN